VLVGCGLFRLQAIILFALINSAAEDRTALFCSGMRGFYKFNGLSSLEFLFQRDVLASSKKAGRCKDLYRNALTVLSRCHRLLPEFLLFGAVYWFLLNKTRSGKIRAQHVSGRNNRVICASAGRLQYFQPERVRRLYHMDLGASPASLTCFTVGRAVILRQSPIPNPH